MVDPASQGQRQAAWTETARAARRARIRRRLLALLLLVALAAVGATVLLGDIPSPPGSPPGSASHDSPEEIRLSEQEEARNFVPKEHNDSGGGSRQFIQPGYDNSIQEFGVESTEAEFRNAAAVMHGYLDALAAENWAAGCEYLSEEIVKPYEESAVQLEDGIGHGCAGALWARWHNLPLSVRKTEADEADAGSLRVKGDQAFLIYYGLENVRKEIGLVQEGGRWKLSALEGYAF